MRGGSEREVFEQLGVFEPVARERTLDAARVALADVRAHCVEQTPQLRLPLRRLRAQPLDLPADTRVALRAYK